MMDPEYLGYEPVDGVLSVLYSSNQLNIAPFVHHLVNKRINI